MHDLSDVLCSYLNINDKNNILFVDRAFLALYAIFTMLKKTGRSKVLFTSNTCPSPVFAALYAGLTPGFVDISIEDYLMDEQKTVETIERDKDDLAGLVYIYTFGHTPKSLNKIISLTQKYDITFIEDVAQAFGSRVGNQVAGTIGDLSVFSFGYSKHIDSGSGGFIVNNNPKKYDHDELGNILSKTIKYSSSGKLEREYKKQFYVLRDKALLKPEFFSQFKDFASIYRALYFVKTEPDWIKIKTKTLDFIENHHKQKRNEVALKYFEGIKGITSDIYAPKVNENYSVYRYTILTQSYIESKMLSVFLRTKGLHCSNLYLPVSRFFHSYNFENSVDFARRCVNLWVDSTASTSYIDKTLRTIELFTQRHQS